MVQALIKISNEANRVVNMIKARYDLQDKGQAIEHIIREYVELKSEPELRPEFIRKMKEIEKQKPIKVNDFAARYGLK